MKCNECGTDVLTPANATGVICAICKAKEKILSGNVPFRRRPIRHDAEIAEMEAKLDYVRQLQRQVAEQLFNLCMEEGLRGLAGSALSAGEEIPKLLPIIFTLVHRVGVKSTSLD